MARILTRTAMAICPTCGRRRLDHPDRNLLVCPVLPDVTAALRRFRDANGRSWKTKLVAAWEQACSLIADSGERALLQQARNLIGPKRLYKIVL